MPKKTLMDCLRFSFDIPLWLLRFFSRSVKVPSILLLVLGIPTHFGSWYAKGTTGRSRRCAWRSATACVWTTSSPTSRWNACSTCPPIWASNACTCSRIRHRPRSRCCPQGLLYYPEKSWLRKAAPSPFLSRATASWWWSRSLRRLLPTPIWSVGHPDCVSIKYRVLARDCFGTSIHIPCKNRFGLPCVFRLLQCAYHGTLDISTYTFSTFLSILNPRKGSIFLPIRRFYPAIWPICDFYLLKFGSSTLIHKTANKHWCFGGFYHVIWPIDQKISLDSSRSCSR